MNMIKNKIYKYNEFISESTSLNIDLDKSFEIATKISKMVTKEVLKKFEKSADKIKPFVKKYTKDNKILLDKLLPILKKEELVSESLSGFNDLLRMFKKFGKGVYDFFVSLKDFLYNIYKKYKKLVGDLSSEYKSKSLAYFIHILVGCVIWVLSYGVYLELDKSINGIDSGVVIDIDFIPYHIEKKHEFVIDANKKFTRKRDIHVPDTWILTVKDLKSDRVEEWKSTIGPFVKKIENGDTVYSEDFNIKKIIKK